MSAVEKMEVDPIQAILATTGLSCDDLLQKLIAYKQINNQKSIQNNAVVKSACESSAKDNKHEGSADISSTVSSISIKKEKDCDLRNNEELSCKDNENIECISISSHESDHNEKVDDSSLIPNKITTTNNPPVGNVETDLQIENIATDYPDNVNETVNSKRNSPDLFGSPNKCSASSILDEPQVKSISTGPPENVDTEKEENTSNATAGSIKRKRTSISDELARKLLKTDDKVGLNSVNESEGGNDIEVCQVDDIEVLQPAVRLKLRDDLFESGANRFPNSDDENETNDGINQSDLREFLTTIEEVTSEVKNDDIPCKQKESVDPSSWNIRKIKTGYLRKRVNHAIKHLVKANSNNDEKYSISTETAEPMEDNEESEASLEEIRENLKQQLSSLRNKKKSNVVVSKVPYAKNLKFNYQVKKLVTEKINESNTKDDKIVGKSSENLENKEVILSMSDHFDFKIADVKSGVELSDDDESEVIVKKKSPPETIKLTKTKDITKIKGWRKKMFQIKNMGEGSSLNQEPDINVDDHVESKSETLSPFVSNSLDEYLTKNATLQISYKIPKLGAEETLNQKKYEDIPPTIREKPLTETDKNKKKPSNGGLKVRTLAEKRRLLEKNRSKEIREIKKINYPLDRTSYVLYNGKIIYVASKDSGKCYGIFGSEKKRAKKPVGETTVESKAKRSLLNDLYLKNGKMSYKAGPLSRKNYLKKCDDNDWITTMRKLPEIKLQIAPQFGKKIRSNLLHLLPPFNPLISKERVELALTALHPNKDEKKPIFVFDVPYANNQTYIKVRKRRAPMPPNVLKLNDIPPEKNTVESVINDLITYVETKVIEDTVLKDAETYEVGEKTCTSPEVTSSNKINRAKGLNLEFRRLNCKVVNVTIEQEDIENEQCNQPFCKFGCVCRSLATTTRLPLHCNKYNCMFECKCAKTDRLTDTNDLLTTDTVTRLDDQAKQNLAKVEREFTQTIIHANDRTILVGSSDRNKGKRVKKPPQRYVDYLNDVEDLQEKEGEIEPLPNPPKHQLSKCFVLLKKLDLEDLIPYCMNHGVHDCPCRIKKTRPEENQTCARMFGVPKEVVERNKIPIYKKKLRLRKSYDACPGKEIIINGNDLIEVDAPQNYDDEIDVTSVDKNEISPERLIKRKQVLTIRYDDDSAKAPVNQLKPDDYKAIFDGEIVIPTEENKEFVRELGMKTAAPFMRMLPWDELIKNYYDSKINIWCLDNKNEKLLINTRDQKPPPGYIEIKNAKKRNGIMTWILSKSLPKDTPQQLVHLILAPSKGHFEISGICLKNLPETTRKHNVLEEPSCTTLENHGDANFMEHKDHLNVLQVLWIQQIKCNTQELRSIPLAPDMITIRVELPQVRHFLRWRMVYLKSNFTFLSFMNNKYSIKYTDLMHIVKKAQAINKTVVLQSRQLSAGYSQKNYGIYAAPNYQDRLFVGPYTAFEDHSLETLRYLRQSLVSTTVFEMLQGGASSAQIENAIWLTSKEIPKKRDPLTNKLMEPTPNVVATKEYAEIIPLPNEKKQEKKIVRKNGLSVTQGKIKPEEYNRFIVTNIPHFGYIGAKQTETGEVEIEWLDSGNILTFPNINITVLYVRKKINQLLLPVPASFQVLLVILKEIDKNSYAPTDPIFFSGSYVCGEFGVADWRKLDPLTKNLGTTLEEIKQRMKERLKHHVRRGVNFPMHPSLVSILQGKVEIEKLLSKEKNLIQQKKMLIIKKQQNLRKFMALIKHLPEHQRVTQYNRFRRMFTKDPSYSEYDVEATELPSIVLEQPKEVTECIEIVDSDTESNDATTQLSTASKPATSKPATLKKKNVFSSKLEMRPVAKIKLTRNRDGKLIIRKTRGDSKEVIRKKNV